MVKNMIFLYFLRKAFKCIPIKCKKIFIVGTKISEHAFWQWRLLESFPRGIGDVKGKYFTDDTEISTTDTDLQNTDLYFDAEIKRYALGLCRKKYRSNCFRSASHRSNFFF